MTPARLRLVALLLGLTALWVIFWVVRPIGEQDLRDALAPLGWTAPVAYVAASTVLGVLLVPGALLAAVAGLLFGPVTGTAATMAAAVLSALLARVVADRTGREGVAELPSPRLRRLEAGLERRGVWAVVVQRLLPGVPDAPCSYLFGLAGVKAWQVALGTFVGSAPRAFSYVALGDAAGTRDTKLALVAGAVLLATGVVGATVGLTVLRRSRRSSA